MNMIALKHISKIFHPGTPNENEVIKDISLNVKKGDFITIIGSNGAGKTTLFNLISGNIMPNSGQVMLGGRDVTRQPEYRRAKTLGRIFQDPLLGTASGMTIEDNMMVAYKKGFKWLKISLNNKMRAIFKKELSKLEMGLENRMQENVSMLSGGQRQALTLLMMVLSNPDNILLDEHTAALDPRNAAIVMNLTRRFVKEYDLTAMMITHNMQHAIEYGNRLIMMDDGEIIIDIEGDDKKNLTTEKLLKMFSEIRKKELQNDEMLLSR